MMVVAILKPVRRGFLQAGLLLSGLALPAYAQTLPGAADPGLIERRFEVPPQPKATGEETETPLMQPSAPPPGAEQATFELKGIVVDGATVYGAADFRPFYERFVGTQVSVHGLYDIAAAITSKYAADGYVLSQAIVPPQRINGDGIARLTVVEGFIDKVIVQGDATDAQELLAIYAYGDKIRASRPLRLADLERYLLLADDLPGLTASGTLDPSQTVPGAADLIIDIAYKPVDGFASFDNRGSRYVGPWQAVVGANANSVLGLAERTSLQLATAPFQPEELKYGSISHDELIGSEGMRASIDYGYTASHTGYTLKPLAVRSRSQTLGFGLSQPLLRSRAKNLSLRGRLELRNSETDQFGDQNVSEDRLTVLRGGGSYDWVDTALTAPAINIVSLDMSQGVDALGARRTGSERLSRASGHSDFFKVGVEASRIQRLYPGISLLTGLSAQWAGASLLSSEQFAFGGSLFGRGYDPAEITGDHGLAGKLELQYAGPEVDFLKDWQLYGFYDIGRVWTISTTGDSTVSAASAGIGVRANLTDSLSVNLELAKPLTHPVATMGDDGKDVRGFFGLVARY